MDNLQYKNFYEMDKFEYFNTKNVLKTNFAFFKIENLTPIKQKFFISKSNQKSIDNILLEIRNYFDELQIEFLIAENLSFVLYELILNAYEHGNLKIDYMLKNRLLRTNSYEEYLKEISNLSKYQKKKIYIDIKLYTSNRNFLIIKIKDEGEGFDVVEMLKCLHSNKNLKYNGRGILMSESLSDGIFYNYFGNEVTVIKYLN